MNAPIKTVNDRDTTAERLLRSSVERSYEPTIDIDWDAPLDPDKYAMHPHRISLYGTELWDGLTEDQRRTLSFHEICSVARIGVWFEVILMQMLLRVYYDLDPRSRHAQYALVEIADECRHSVMFGKMIDKFGVGELRPIRPTHELGRLFKTVAHGPALFAATLFVEEILDQIQREGMRDDSLQPLMRQVHQIHVTEEARHVRYAREELLRIMPTVNRFQLAEARWWCGRVAFVVARNLIHRDVYRSVGIDPVVGHKAALANPHHQETLRWAARKVTPFLREQGIIGGWGEAWWRSAYLI